MSKQLKTIQQMGELQAAIDAMQEDIRALQSSYIQGVHVDMNITTADYNHKGSRREYKLDPERLAAFLESEVAEKKRALQELVNTITV